MNGKKQQKGLNSLQIRRLTYTALYLAIALILPFITGQIPEIGAMLSPMHIPVLLCGFMCGWPYGLAVGFIAPLLRSVLFGMPAMFPGAMSMAFELAVYGSMTGILYRLLPRKRGVIYADIGFDKSDMVMDIVPVRHYEGKTPNDETKIGFIVSIKFNVIKKEKVYYLS